MQSELFLCTCSLQIQPPLIRSHHYVRNEKRDKVSLRVSHVVVEANERQPYLQASVHMTVSRANNCDSLFIRIIKIIM